jgi:hypothetical protein
MADKLDGGAIVANTIPGTKIQSGTITTAQLDPAIATAVTIPLHPKISSITYPGDDTAANTGGGDSIVINGSGFGTNVQVYINNSAVPSVTRNNANAVTITTAAQSAGTYLVYLINTDDGGTAILVPGIQYSGTPTWVTESPLDQQQALSAWSISLSATGDSPIVYTLQAGSSLPDGITLAANGLISGTMTSPPAEDTTYNFTVVATDPEQQDTPKAFSVSVTVVVDPQFQYTTLLLQADGTNNGNNHTFLDSSNNNFTITRNGNATQGSFTPFSPTGWSNYFDRSGDTLQFADNANLEIGSGDFTIEAWVYLDQYSATYGGSFYGVGICGKDNETTRSYAFQISTSGTSAYTGLNAVLFTGASAVQTGVNYSFQLNQWYHIAFARQSGTIRFFVNGQLIGSGSNSTSTNNGSQPFVVGAAGLYTGYEYFFPGYISNFRFVNGTAVYTASFTPSTTPLTNIANTAVLTCQSNRFIDNSNNNFAITRNGNVSIQAFSPFATTTAYSPATHGGAAFFDGSGDYLQNTSITNQFDVGSAFTIDLWVYVTTYQEAGWFSTGGSTVNWSTSTGLYWSLYQYNGTLYWQTGLGNGSATNLITATSPAANAWHHIAIGFNGTTTRMWIDGVSVGTSTTAYYKPSGTDRVQVGCFTGGSTPYAGYFSGVRFVKGTDVYGVGNTTITVPTSPPSNIANTSLLLNFTNAQIYDAAAGAVLECVGDAKVNTSIKKYGAGSIVFDGTGDYLSVPWNEFWNIGSGDYTVECWLKTSGAVGEIVSAFNQSSPYPGWLFGVGFNSNNGKLTFYNANGSSSETKASTLTVNDNNWHHVAVTKSGTTLKFFIDGLLDSTHTLSLVGTGSNQAIRIGADNNSSPSRYLNGYIDDLRISKGLARYRYNFTPPTRAFATKGGSQTLTADEYFDYTTLLLPGNGTNNQNNHTFLDSSNNNFTITRNGNATQGTFSPFSQTGWSMYQSDINGAYISFTTSVGTAFQFTGDFTVECWVYPVSYSGTGDTSAWVTYDGSTYFALNYDASGNYNIYLNSGSPTSTFSSGIALNQWNHIAMVRSGSTVTLYTNGLLRGTISNSSTLGHANPSLARNGGGAASNVRYMSNLRIVKGTAVYTSNFTPPTSPLTAIANTQLLTVQSNRWKDNSNNNFTPTVTGTPGVQAFSPFAPTASYAAANVGGSGYFDGSGDYLSVPSDNAFDVGSGNFTMEAWIYPTSYGADYGIIIARYTSGGASNQPFSLTLETNGTVRGILNGTYVLQTTATAPLNTWTHVAFTRSSNDFTIWLNGVSSATLNQSVTVNNPSIATTVGAFGLLSSNYLTGYISGLRVVKGTAVYTAAFTPSTAPLTAISNTQLLCNFTNAGITDATAKSVLETVGAAKVNTAIKQFGSGSIDLYTNNNTDYLYVKSSSAADLGGGDFTVEFWMYPQTLSTSFSQDTYSCIMDADSAAGASSTAWWVVHQYNQTIYWATDGGSTAGQTGNIITAANTWYHVAISRASGVVRTFVNGNLANTVSYSTAIGAQNRNLYIGKQPTTSRYFKGYLDDIRITKGIARYTQNFILPTTEFLTK